MEDLENIHLENEGISLEEGALIASGVKDRNSLQSYSQKLSRILQDMPPAPEEGDEYTHGKSLFDWLWLRKPKRYRSGRPFRLTEVIDAHISENTDEVGNCLGLTLLFNVLAKRSGLIVQAVYLEDEFGGNPHVRSVLACEGQFIDVEHMSPAGYDFQDKRSGIKRLSWNDRELIADIYHSRGNLLFQQGKLVDAVRIYDKSLLLNPRYTKAYINAATALLVLGRQQQAQAYLEKASPTATS